METSRFTVLVLVFAASVCSRVCSASPVLLALGDESAYQEGCLEPCDCVLYEPQEAVGSLMLAPKSDFGTFKTWSVLQVNIHTEAPDGPLDIVGEGVYSILAEFAVLQRLELTLSLNGGDPIPFDSGWVPAASEDPLSGFDIALAMNNFKCYDKVLSIHAKPVDPAALIQFRFVKGGSYAEGCFGLCLCPVFFGGEPTGAFALLPLKSKNSTIYNVIGFTTTVKYSNESPGILTRFRGFGSLMPKEDAWHMTMYLTEPGGPQVAFHSTPDVIATDDLNELNVTLSMNDLECYDIVIGIVAKSSP